MIFRNAFTDDHVSVDLDFATIEDVKVLSTDKISRACSTSRYVKCGSGWRPLQGKPLTPVMAHVVDHFSKIMYMAELVQSRSELEKELKTITDQEFDLHTRFQVNSFRG